MITLEQVRALEARVEKALGAIDRLTAENATLLESVARENKRAAELERTIEEFRRDQTKIEQGILHALERLNAFEDAILDPAPDAAGKHVSERAAPAASAVKSAASPAKPAAPIEKSAASESASSAVDGATPESGKAGAELEIF